MATVAPERLMFEAWARTNSGALQQRPDGLRMKSAATPTAIVSSFRAPIVGRNNPAQVARRFWWKKRKVKTQPERFSLLTRTGLGPVHSSLLSPLQAIQLRP